MGLAALILMGLDGCVTYDRSGQAVINDWNRQFGVTSGDGVGRLPVDEKMTLEGFVYQGIAVKDYEYKKYVDLLRRGTSWSGFGAQAASIGLNAAVPLTGTGTGKTLSAIAGAITGTSARTSCSTNRLRSSSAAWIRSGKSSLRKSKRE